MTFLLTNNLVVTKIKPIFALTYKKNRYYMKRLLLITLTLLSLGISAQGKHTDKTIDSLYRELDHLIDIQPNIIQEKEARIRVIRDGLDDPTLTADQRYKINERLYDEYMAYRFDSAFKYIQLNIEVQRALGDEERYAASVLRMTHILSVSGIFNNARQLLWSINPERLNPELRAEYYDQQGELNLYRSEMAAGSPFFPDYMDSLQHYRQKILSVAPHSSYAYIFNMATYTCEQGQTDRAIRMLENYLPQLHQGGRRYSIVCSTLAYFYGRYGQPLKQERYLLLSAISDLKGSILENNALREVALMLMERGQNEKAFHYLTHAASDARNYGSRLRSLQAARIAPIITKIYDEERTRAEKHTLWLLITISIIALMLIITIVHILVLTHRRHADSKKIQQMNEKLKHQNELMQAINAEVKEANRIKEQYLMRFMFLGSYYISVGSERMKKMNRLAREKKMAELYDNLKDYSALNENTRLFYQNFDEAFLNIYPNFISEVNKLLREDNPIIDDSGEEPRKHLTTELRILALLRLGITDNQKIADILRSSLTTIYTYRSKLKARAKQKESFEDDVKCISTY